MDEITDRLEAEPFNLSFDRTEDLRSSLGDSWQEASGYAASGVQAGIGLITGLVLAIAILYFVLRDGARLWAWILALFSPSTRPAIDRAGRRAWDVLGGFVRGTALIAAIDASLIGLGLWILGVPLAFALAVLVFMAAFVPFVGAFVSGLVAALVAFADGGWELGLATLVLVVAVQLIEGNFLQPIIQSRTVDLHPAVILLAVAAGASLFGIAGAYLAVPSRPWSSPSSDHCGPHPAAWMRNSRGQAARDYRSRRACSSAVRSAVGCASSRSSGIGSPLSIDTPYVPSARRSSARSTSASSPAS